MVEPIYEYVKGVGWQVATRYPTFYTHDKEGRQIRMIERFPLPGESWIYKCPENDRGRGGGLKQAMLHLQSFRFEGCPIVPGKEKHPGRYYAPPGVQYNEHYVLELVDD